jgi:hypothetical protein
MPACSNNSLEVKSTSLQEETQFGRLSSEEQTILGGLNSAVIFDADIYDKVSAVTIGKYRVLFIPDEPDTAIYIVKDKKIVMSVHETHQSIYSDTLIAPAYGSEKVFVSGDYLMFTNGKKTFQSYGFNGIDVIQYDRNSLDSFDGENYRNNLKCPHSMLPGAACCYDDEGEIRPYMFYPKSGWNITDNERLIEFCQSHTLVRALSPPNTTRGEELGLHMEGQ